MCWQSVGPASAKQKTPRVVDRDTCARSAGRGIVYLHAPTSLSLNLYLPTNFDSSHRSMPTCSFADGASPARPLMYSLLLVLDRLHILFGFALLFFLVLWHANEPVEEDCTCGIERNKSKDDAKVTPSVSVAHVECREEGVGAADTDDGLVHVHTFPRNVCSQPRMPLKRTSRSGKSRSWTSHRDSRGSLLPHRCKVACIARTFDPRADPGEGPRWRHTRRWCWRRH